MYKSIPYRWLRQPQRKPGRLFRALSRLDAAREPMLKSRMARQRHYTDPDSHGDGVVALTRQCLVRPLWRPFFHERPWPLRGVRPREYGPALGFGTLPRRIFRAFTSAFDKTLAGPYRGRGIRD